MEATPSRAKFQAVRPILSGLQVIPGRGQWRAQTPAVFTYGLVATPTRAPWQVQTPLIPRIELARGAAGRWQTPPPVVSLDTLPFAAEFSFAMATALEASINDTYLLADWLVEIPDAGIKWSYVYDDDGTWEHRLGSIGDIEISVPPGGGVSTVSDVTITAYESDDGSMGIRQSWATNHRLIGAGITIRLYFQESNTDFIIFTGVVQAVTINNSVATIVAVDRSLPTNTLIPRHVLTEDQYPAAAPGSLGQALPLLYGQGSRIQAAPMLFVDTEQYMYLAAEHGLYAMGTTYAVFDGATQVFLAGSGNVTTDALQNTFTFAHAIQEIRFGVTTGTVYIQESVNATNAGAVIDGLSTPVATIGTGTTAPDLDGYGLIGVAVNFGSAARGGNTVTISASQHRRALHSDPTVTGQFRLQTIRPATTGTPIISRADLFRSENFRHSLNPQNTTFTVTSVEVGPSEALECVVYARHEGGPGTASNFYEIGELVLTVFRQLTGDNPPVFLYQDFQGRMDDSAGNLTGVPSSVLSTFSDVIGSIILYELGLSFNTTAWAVARQFEVAQGSVADGGIGQGWGQPRTSARELLDALARQCRSVLFVDYDGAWRLAPYTDPTEYPLITTDEILFSEGAGAGVDPERSSTFSLSFGRIEEIGNNFEVHYKYNTALGQYGKVVYASHEGSNASHIGDPENLNTLCVNSEARYGPLAVKRIEAPLIYDDLTAELLLRHQVQYFWSNRITASFEVPIQIATELLPGSFVQLVHHELPEEDNGGIFEVHSITFRPSVGRARLVASRATRVSFEYTAIKDQNNVIWFVWVDIAGQIVLDTSTPASLFFIPTSVAPAVIPSWWQMTDELGATWYVYPHTTGELLIDSSAPPIGAGLTLVSGQTLKAQSSRLYRLGVLSPPTITIEQVTA